ncbi:hypothetical protein AB1K70_22830 [Bremerella sp. JC770]|uniref:tetratricopeptide repeat protein n=1 Tax=Bremerella sp. JC770 TaxID=3232137 RepID=UPI00345892AA
MPGSLQRRNAFLLLGFLTAAAMYVASLRTASAQNAVVNDTRSPQQMIEEYRRLDGYLSKLKMPDQRLLLIERYLKHALPAQEREELLDQGSQLYATQLMLYADDPTRSKHYQQKVQQFLSDNPSADTPAIQVMLLQADYNRGEAAVTRWLNDPSDKESLAEARSDFARIAPKLVDYHKSIQKRIEEQWDVIDRMPSGSGRDNREKVVRELEGVVGRAAFFGAWSNYYLSLVEGIQGPSQYSKIAVQLFRGLLDLKIDPKASTPWHEAADPNRMGLEQEWRARALIGLAMSEILDDDVLDGQRCFTLLEAGPTSADIADQSDYWYCRGLINAGKLDEAADFAKMTINDFQGNSSPGKTSLCVLLADTGLREGADTPKIRDMGIQGLIGLAKLGHHSAAIQLVEKYDLDLENSQGFYMMWLIGQQKFADAEKSKSDDDYRSAQSQLRDALAAPEAKKDLLSASECRYTLAWCSYRLEEHAEAGMNFQDAVSGLKGPNPGKAAEAAWMAFVSYQALAKEEPRYGLRAIEVLEDLKRDFPNHQYAQKADYFIAKLQQSRGSMTSSIRQLQSISPNDPNYWSAKFDLCNLLRQQIDQASSDDEKKELAGQLKNVADDLQSRLNQSSAPEDRVSGVVRCLLNVSDLARKDILPAGDFAKYVGAVKPLVASLPPGDRAWVDYHYQALMLARTQKNDSEVGVHADWLLKHAKGTPYEQSALIIRALEIDQQVAATTMPDMSLLEEGFDIYSRLVKHLGATSGAVQQSKNAKVACSKAADFAEQLHRWSDAATYLRVLVAAYPKEQEYLQRLGRVEFTLQNYPGALGHWRTLLVGLNKGDEAWFEAKYYQLACLQQTDRDQAKTVLEQFQLLHPDWGLPPWRDKIKTLAQQISGSGGS